MKWKIKSNTNKEPLNRNQTVTDGDRFPHLVINGCGSFKGGFGVWSVVPTTWSKPFVWPKDCPPDIVLEFPEVRLILPILKIG
ncbi:MAG: hypothetical protein ACK50N_01295 [Flavobacteriales bacterium]